MNKFKKSLAFLMTLVFVLGIMPVYTAHASSITVDKSPVASTVGTMSMSSLASMINSAGVTYNYTDNEGNTVTGKVTADMCYLYGAYLYDTTFNRNVDLKALNIHQVTELVNTATLSLLKGQTYTLSVRANDTNVDFTFVVSDIVSYTWPKTLTKTQYFVGEALDLTGDYITANYANGATSKIQVTADMLYGIAQSSDTVPPTHANRYLLSTTKAATYMNTPGTYSFAIAYDKIDSTFDAGYGADNDAWIYFQKPSIPVGISDELVSALQIYATNDAKYRKNPYSANGAITYQITVSAQSAYTPKLRYSAHVQNIGWQGYYYSPNTAGTTGKSLRMEAVKIDIVNKNNSLGDITYRTHVQNKGWMDWVKTDVMSGTTSESLRAEAIEIKFDGQYEKLYNVEYRVHVQNQGWTDWKKNGETAGTTGKSLRMEAIEIRTTLK